ncbi:MAG: hypothetical protein J07HQW2_01915 [Haloquadratum walsbyi J07HQW2]|uniref:Uncharacterized protein n=1 Tax=Haloquadratum walsbyi J07HQW2 TaxID=1238425 RepID=U1NF96_9EURY|nr:MAG: hypothetical protein J07HQW2_01915 [Haloquadratum walsbyi J07HQW2]
MNQAEWLKTFTDFLDWLWTIIVESLRRFKIIFNILTQIMYLNINSYDTISEVPGRIPLHASIENIIMKILSQESR